VPSSGAHEPRTVVFEPTLIVRRSTARARA
jgi:hypothetical protein